MEFKDNVNAAYLNEMGDWFGFVTRERVHWVCKQVRGESVLDIGCSGGVTDVLLAREGKQVLGLDTSQRSINDANALKENEDQLVQERLTFVNQDVMAYDFEDQKFDTVIMAEVLEHLLYPERILEKVKTLLKDEDSRVIITVPFGINDWPDHKTTYYVGNLTALISAFFHVTDITILFDRYLCLSACHQPAEGASFEPSLELAESSFFGKEKMLFEVLYHRKEKIAQLNDQLAKISQINQALKNQQGLLTEIRASQLSGENIKKIAAEVARQSDLLAKIEEEVRIRRQIDDLQEALLERQSAHAALQQELEERESANAALQQTLNLEQEKNKQLQQDLKAKKALIKKVVRQRDILNFSESYRIGNLIVKTLKNPTTVFSWPGKMVRYLKMKRDRKRMVSGKTSKSEKAAKPISKPEPAPVEKKFLVNDDVSDVTFPDLKIAVIMDTFTYNCFKYEARLIQLTPENFREEIDIFQPDLVFVESAWNGYQKRWQYKINHAADELVQLITYCREKEIPSVFWNKEDPPHFEHFIKSAKLFDYVYTTAEECIPKYQQDLAHDNISVLMFAAQPRIHNPVRSKEEKKQYEWLNPICFAGSYYQEKYPERGRHTRNLLNAAIPWELDIYDRNYELGFEKYRFPEKYHPYIIGSISYEQLVKLQKYYDVILNVNTVRDSKSMFSRRVFECLASMETVLSSPSIGMENLFGDIVGVAENEKEASKFLEQVLTDKQFKEKQLLKGLRLISHKHTFTQRLVQICTDMNINVGENQNLGVSVVVSTNKPQFMENIFENYVSQKYSNKELIIILNNDAMHLEEWQEKANQYPDESIQIFQLDEEIPLGRCLNYGFEHAKFDFLTKFDDDNYYAPDFIGDLMMYFDFTDADIIGKTSYYVYYEATKILALRFAGSEQQYHNFTSGSAMIFTRQLFENVQFPEGKNVGEDTHFLKQAIELGYKIYSADRFNYVVSRRPDLSSHTWKIDDAEHIKKCKIIGEFEDYRDFVSV